MGWLVEDRFLPLLEGHPQIDRLHVYRRRPKRALLGLIRELRAEKYEIALDLQGNLKSGFMTRMSGAKRRMGLGAGYSKEGNHLFLEELVEPPHTHNVKNYLALLDAAVGAGPHAYGLLPAEPDDHGAIVLHPFVSKFFSNKTWPAENFAELGDRLARRLDAPVAITAGPGETDAARAIADRMQADARVLEPAGLGALKNTLAGARLFVGADTGPTHIAAALGVPTLGLLGPTDPEKLAPYGPRSRGIASGARCSPCKLRWCPDTICMSGLDVDRVEAAALELLA
ncbi:MAG: glycosyltransferase family 9 protein [Planctomycetota bacterium]